MHRSYLCNWIGYFYQAGIEMEKETSYGRDTFSSISGECQSVDI